MTQQNFRAVSESRWFVLGVALCMFLLMGVYYGWSIFVGPLEREFGWARSQTSLPLTICLVMFCFGAVAGGLLGKIWPHRFTVWLGALSIGVGFSLASRAASLPELCIGYGVMGGAGIGAAYNAILSTVLGRFSDRLGLASGLLMMCYGLGGLVINIVGSRVIEAWDWRVTMFGMAVAISGVMLLGGLFLKPPPAAQAEPYRAQARAKARRAPAEEALDLSPRQMVLRRSFQMYFIWVLLLYASGLMLIGHAVPFAGEQGLGAGTAALLAGAVAACNGVGRLLSGLALDRFGRKMVMRGISCCFIIASGLLFLAPQLHSAGLATAGYILVGLSYGATVACTVAVVNLFYGARNYSINFSLANFASAFAALLGPYLAGFLHKSTGGYGAMTIAMFAFGCAALLLAIQLKRP